MKTPFFIADFLTYLLVEKRYSSHTIVAYQKDLAEFEEFILPTTVEQAESKIVRSYIYYLKNNQLSNTTINRKISSLRSFYKWLEKNEVIQQNPLSKVVLLKQPKRLPTFVKEESFEVEKINEVFNTNSFDGLRDSLMVEVLYQT